MENENLGHAIRELQPHVLFRNRKKKTCLQTCSGIRTATCGTVAFLFFFVLHSTGFARNDTPSRQLGFSPDSVYIRNPQIGDTTICMDSRLTLFGFFRNADIMRKHPELELHYAWEYTPDTAVRGPVVIQSGTFRRGMLSMGHSIVYADKSCEGFYRLTVENKSDDYKCFRYSSRYVRIRVFELRQVSDEHLYFRPSIGMQLHLRSYIDTLLFPPNAVIKWTPTPGSPHLEHGTEIGEGRIDVGTLQTQLDFVYNYEVRACGVSTAKFVLHPVSEYNKRDTIRLCIDPYLPLNTVINLSAIMGVHSNYGYIGYPVDPDGIIRANVKTARGKPALMNLLKAYDAAKNPKYYYNKDKTVKQFIVQYKDTKIMRKVVLIVGR
jgi:hypothetical protein